MDNITGTQRQLIIRVVALASLIAAVIHFAVSGEHFQEYWAFGVFMLAAAWLQLGWAIAVLLRPTRPLLIAGGLVNAGIVAVYLVTRTVGDVIGPTPHAVEPVGFGDAFCTVCEVLIVIGVLVLCTRPLLTRITRRTVNEATAIVAVTGMALLSFSLVDGGSEMVMTMSSASAPAAHGSAHMAMTAQRLPQVSLATDSPAGPVHMPGAMQMMPGMKMAAGPCTAGPTVAQEAATVRLVNATWAADKKYRSLKVAEAAGFRPLTPPGRAVVHYINVTNYIATMEGGKVLNPAAPQSLVYANTPHGAVLAAVMYITSPNITSAPPDPGGCLTQWHIHTNLCFRGAHVVGILDPTCPIGSVNHVTQPMIHIWFVPIPGGPTAIDAPDAQVVRAAEQVHSPPNPRV